MREIERKLKWEWGRESVILYYGGNEVKRKVLMKEIQRAETTHTA